VGKSCLLTQFIEQKFSTKYQMTVGVEFVSRTINIDNDTVKLQIWDTVIKNISKQRERKKKERITFYFFDYVKIICRYSHN
jgi:Ras-related protein Rab-2A